MTINLEFAVKVQPSQLENDAFEISPLFSQETNSVSKSTSRISLITKYLTKQGFPSCPCTNDILNQRIHGTDWPAAILLFLLLLQDDGKCFCPYTCLGTLDFSFLLSIMILNLWIPVPSEFRAAYMFSISSSPCFHKLQIDFPSLKFFFLSCLDPTCPKSKGS